MTTPKKKTINITNPSFPDIKMDEGRFVLEVYSERHLIRLHFKRRWIVYLASLLWKFIKSEEEEIEDTKKALRGEE